jgi:hypothetical protein
MATLATVSHCQSHVCLALNLLTRTFTEVYDVLTRCGFSETYYNAQSASSVLVSVASSFAQASGSVIVTTSGTAVLTSSVRASTQVPSQTAGAAPAKTAAVGVGMLGLAVGLL